MVVPFLTLYLTDSLNFTLNQAGTAGMCFGIGSVLSSYVGGHFTDRYGYANVMKFSLLTGGLSFWALMFCSTFISFCSIVFLTAFLADLLRPAVLSSISLFSKEENQTRAISLLRMAINLGISVGPVVGGFMVTYYGYDWLFILNGGTSILTFFVFIYVNRSMKQQRQPKLTRTEQKLVKKAYKDKDFLWLLVIVFILFTAFIQIIFIVPKFFKEVYEMTELSIGWFFTINGLLIVIFEMPIVHFYEKKRQFKRPILLGSWLMVIAFLALLIPVGSHKLMWFVPFIIYTLAIGIGEILNLPFLSSLALARSNNQNSGSYMGLFALNTSLAFTLAPIIGSRVVSFAGFSELWLLCAVMMLVTIIMFSAMSKRFLINKNFQ